MLYPINLQLTDRSCLVIGGGRVALRKIRGLLACDGRVTVISPEVIDAIDALAGTGKITLYRRPYMKGDLAGAFLVFAATDDDQVQNAIVGEAAERQVLLNSGDDPRRSDFHVPARVRRGELLLTVSTDGASPMLAGLIRGELETRFDERYAVVVRLMARIRQSVLSGSTDPGANRRLFERLLLQTDLLDCVKEGRWQQAAVVLRRELPATIDIEAVLHGLANG
ncbi:MAG: bifunctional precorrin-2 dehydrogenase/sirohydrochlorin ferrochelatase [Desulfopila sp.]